MYSRVGLMKEFNNLRRFYFWVSLFVWQNFFGQFLWQNIFGQPYTMIHIYAYVMMSWVLLFSLSFWWVGGTLSLTSWMLSTSWLVGGPVSLTSQLSSQALAGQPWVKYWLFLFLLLRGGKVGLGQILTLVERRRGSVISSNQTRAEWSANMWILSASANIVFKISVSCLVSLLHSIYIDMTSNF